MKKDLRSKRGMATLAGAVLTALAVGSIPLASAALDGGGFTIRAVNGDDPAIFGMAGMAATSTGGGETDPGDGGGETTPPEPEVPKEKFVFTISTTAPGCANPVVSFAGLSNSPTITNPSGAKAALNEGSTAVAASGQWTVEGNFNKFAVGSGSASNCLTSVDEWGATGTTDLSNAFMGANNITAIATPPSTIRDISGIFQHSSFNLPLSSWDVSNVTKMVSSFSANPAFNQNISGWNVANVTDFSGMFNGATAFDQPIGSWTTSSALNMSNMFRQTPSFDQSLNNWDVSKVTDMGGMFAGSGYNKSMSNWQVQSVRDMQAMFAGATSFNRDLSTWQPFQVTNMTEMFMGASSFRQDLSMWYVGNVQEYLHFGTGAQIIREPNWSFT